MSLLFRTFILLLKRALFPPQKQSMFEPCYTDFRVGISDIDINLHMNNGRYLSMMDLGRYDLLLKSKSLFKAMKKGLYPVVVSEGIRFKKSLEPFQRYQIRTEFEGLTERDFFIRQTFLVKDKVYAIGLIKGRFLKKGRSISTHQFIEEMGLERRDEPLSKLSQSLVGLEIELNQLFADNK